MIYLLANNAEYNDNWCLGFFNKGVGQVLREFREVKEVTDVYS